MRTGSGMPEVQLRLMITMATARPQSLCKLETKRVSAPVGKVLRIGQDLQYLSIEGLLLLLDDVFLGSDLTLCFCFYIMLCCVCVFTCLHHRVVFLLLGDT